ncbi:MAG TPA: hypothetical protein VF808_13835 [Ktedonobacterales bacterium]
MRVWATGVGRWSRARARLAAKTALAALIAALALAAWLLPLSSARAAARDASGVVTIDIQKPQASGGVAEGPVGANILAQGAVPAGDSVTIGYAPQSAGCQSGFQAVPGAQPSVASDGTFTVTFSWPSSSNVNTEYYVCAQDSAVSTIGQSNILFRVDAGSAPAIQAQAVADPNAPTVAPGTPTPAPTATPGDGKFYIGGFAQVTGVNFTPGGQNISFFLTPGPFAPSSYNPNSALKVVSGDIRTASDGSFTVVVQLPTGEAGALTLSAVSQDGTAQTLPTLVGSQTVTLVTPPATPTPIPTTQATVQPTTTPGGSGKNRAPGPIRIAGLIGLGVLSVILFIIGVAFLISASSMPKPEI